RDSYHGPGEAGIIVVAPTGMNTHEDKPLVKNKSKGIITKNLTLRLEVTVSYGLPAAEYFPSFVQFNWSNKSGQPLPGTSESSGSKGFKIDPPDFDPASQLDLNKAYEANIVTLVGNSPFLAAGIVARRPFSDFADVKS